MGGYITPGKPVTFMLLKTYLGWTPEFTLCYLNSMKLGHHMKCPPRLLQIQSSKFQGGGTESGAAVRTSLLRLLRSDD